MAAELGGYRIRGVSMGSVCRARGGRAGHQVPPARPSPSSGFGTEKLVISSALEDRPTLSESGALLN